MKFLIPGQNFGIFASSIKGMDTFLFEMSMKWMFRFKNFRNVYWHGKTHSALAAFVRFRSRMDFLMFPQIRNAKGSIITLAAFLQFFSLVIFQRSPQSVYLCRCWFWSLLFDTIKIWFVIFTLTAQLRFDLAMYYHHMSFQSDFVCICIFANFAFEFVWTLHNRNLYSETSIW